MLYDALNAIRFSYQISMETKYQTLVLKQILHNMVILIMRYNYG